MLDAVTIASFADRLRGSLLRPEDAGYDAARTIWNAMIDRRPALIARCASADDVRIAVEFARTHDLLVSIRGGGHNVAGHAVCDDGLMIDLSPMKNIEVDRAGRTVVAQPGCTLADLDRATDSFGLAVPAGIISATGIAGLTLGGGVGWLVRKYGLTCDNLLAADVVTANGRMVTASVEDNSDLFWGLRGGGGNFGIVTSFRYRAHEVTRVLGGMVVHPRKAARDVLRFYRDFTRQAPDELTVYCACLSAADGAPIIAVIACYCGDPAHGERVLAPLRRFGSPIADTIAAIPRLTMQTLFDPAFPYGNRNYWKSSFLEELGDEAIDTLIEHAGRMTSPLSAVMCEYYYGGPSSRIGETDTAFAHRGAQYDLGIIGQWRDQSEDERHVRWVRESYDAMAPYASGRIYANLMGGDQMTEETQLRAAFGCNYERLVELKREYDPDNFFRLNQNIKP